MRWHPIWGLILFFLAALVSGSIATGAEPAHETAYATQNLEGFKVYVHPTVARATSDGFGRRPLNVLAKELNDLKRILHPRIVETLQTVPIWVEWDRQDALSPGAIARYYGGEAEKLAQLGGDARKANCVEVLTLRRLCEIRRPGTALQQVILLHELAHVVHHRLLGWDNSELALTFRQAADRNLYENVNDRFGRQGKAYARTNAAEYFAELSCAYLDSCNYFPFNHEQLRGYDPAGFAFVARVWREPERLTIVSRHPLAPKSAVLPVAGKAPAAKVVPAVASPTAERDAWLLLDRIRLQIRQGENQAARTALQSLLAQFPTTDAASEARECLASLP